MPNMSLIPPAENQYIEFKREETSAQTLAEEIVAFANGEGGDIWLGVDDQGKAIGLSRNYEEDVMNICRTAVIPPICPAYQTLQASNLNGETVNIARLSFPKAVIAPTTPLKTVISSVWVRPNAWLRVKN